MKRNSLAPLAALTLAALGLGCANSPDGPIVKPPGNLNILALQPGHPALVSSEISFYALKGEDREGAIQFAGGEEYLRLEVPAQSLKALPDGTPIANGDSVKITLRVVNPDSIHFEFQPAGLTFSAAKPASLKIEYGEAGDDLNDDGTVDAEDTVIEHELAVWVQEQLGAVYTQLVDVKLEDSNEIEADLLGFSRFAIAY